MEDQTELVNNLLYAQNLENENKLLESTNHIQKKNLRIRNFLLIVIALFAVTLLVKWYDLNRANHKIRIQNEELQKRNELIIAQSTELSELLSNRDRLFSIIAHDLRNPFNSILLTLDILSNNLKNSTHEQMEKRIFRLNQTAKSTYELLEKLLLWAKNQKENNAPNKVELTLFELVEEAFEPLLGTAQLKKVEFVNDIKPGLTIFADRDMMLTILRNLAQNALKFSRENGKIEITTEANSELATICVTDYGVGMDQNTQQNIFTFESTKIRNGTSGEKGSGLGLVLCKQFVEKNNGEIWFDSALEKGTKVYFTVPVIAKMLAC